MSTVLDFGEIPDREALEVKLRSGTTISLLLLGDLSISEAAMVSGAWEKLSTIEQKGEAATEEDDAEYRQLVADLAVRVSGGQCEEEIRGMRRSEQAAICMAFFSEAELTSAPGVLMQAMRKRQQERMFRNLQTGNGSASNSKATGRSRSRTRG